MSLHNFKKALTKPLALIICATTLPIFQVGAQSATPSPSPALALVCPEPVEMTGDPFAAPVIGTASSSSIFGSDFNVYSVNFSKTTRVGGYPLFSVSRQRNVKLSKIQSLGLGKPVAVVSLNDNSHLYFTNKNQLALVTKDSNVYDLTKNSDLAAHLNRTNAKVLRAIYYGKDGYGVVVTEGREIISFTQTVILDTNDDRGNHVVNFRPSLVNGVKIGTIERVPANLTSFGDVYLAGAGDGERFVYSGQDHARSTYGLYGTSGQPINVSTIQVGRADQRIFAASYDRRRAGLKYPDYVNPFYNELSEEYRLYTLSKNMSPYYDLSHGFLLAYIPFLNKDKSHGITLVRTGLRPAKDTPIFNVPEANVHMGCYSPSW